MATNNKLAIFCASTSALLAVAYYFYNESLNSDVEIEDKEK